MYNVIVSDVVSDEKDDIRLLMQASMFFCGGLWMVALAVDVLQHGIELRERLVAIRSMSNIVKHSTIIRNGEYSSIMTERQPTTAQQRNRTVSPFAGKLTSSLTLARPPPPKTHAALNSPRTLHLSTN